MALMVGAPTAFAGVSDLTPAGCVAQGGSENCATGFGLDLPRAVAISPDGTSAYVVTRGAEIAIFDRDPDTGALLEKNGTAGCISSDGSGGACIVGTGVGFAVAVAVSPDGTSVYVGSGGGTNALSIFHRDTTTGALSQLPGTAGCISADGSGGACTLGVAFDGTGGVTVSPDNKNVYVVTTQGSRAVTIFDRDTATGGLTQKTGLAACISEDGTGGLCQDGIGLDGAFSVVVSPDGANVYIASYVSGTVTIFDRNTTTGALTQKAGLAGCISDDGSAGLCQDGVALNSAIGVAISPDGTNVYISSSGSNALATFDRDTVTGALSQKAGLAGCISEDGTGGLCSVGIGLGGAFSVAVTSDGASVYVVASGSAAVAAFDRNTTTGTPTQLPGAAGCVSQGGGEGCTVGRGLVTALGIAVSPDGKNVYAATQDSQAIATFDRGPVPNQLLITTDGGAPGTVTSAPAGIACGRDCSQNFAAGTLVTLTAAAPDGSTFAGFIGPGCTGVPTACTVAVNGVQLVTARFTPTPRTLAVTKAGTGQGTVTSQPAGINCGADCSADYPNGATVTLTVRSIAVGSRFVGLEGAGCAGTATTCTVTMDRAQTVTARFEALPRTLTVTKAGTGQGTVTSQPAGIDCGHACSADFASGSIVTLRAVAAAGSSFAGFTGPGCGGPAPTCAVPIDRPRSAVTATFTTDPPPALSLVGGLPVGALGAVGPAAADVVRPVVSGLRVSPSHVALGSGLPVLTPSGKPGSSISFSLSEPATVSLSFARRSVGRRVGGACRTATPALRGRAACTRYAVVTPRVTIAAAAGVNRIRFQGRLSRSRALAPGRYRLTVIATDAAGNRSRPRQTTLTAGRETSTASAAR